jgi:NAD(P)-dependent dehydrogenase (short-subunit alcohol dehydrogenase family)
MEEDEWDSVLAVNIKGVFLMTRAVVGSMVARQSGTILNIASAAGKRGFPLSAHYVASKFAVVGFTQGVALEVAAAGVRVNAVCPGIIDTPMHRRELAWGASRRGVDVQVISDYLRDMIPLGRIGTAEDVTRVVLFLCSEDANYMTGQAINIGGGLIIGA